MTITVSNFSTQILLNLGVTYIDQTTAQQAYYSMTLAAGDPPIHIGNVGTVPDQASSCVSVTVQTTKGPVVVLYGQQPALGSGVNLSFYWGTGDQSIVVVIDDFDGGTM